MKNPYLYALLQGFTEISVYSLDFLIGTAQSIGLVGIYIFLWAFVIPATDATTIYDRTAYFILVNGIAMVIGGARYRYAKEINNTIKAGELSHYLLKPINPAIFLYIKHLGSRATDIFIGLIFMAAAIIMRPPTSVVSIFFFCLTIITALIVTASLNLISGSIGFWTTEANGIKNAFAQVTRLLNGQMLPLRTFKEALGPIWGASMYLLPFSAVAFTPAMLLTVNEITQTELTYIYSALIWSVLMPLLATLIWKRGLKHYEGTGS
jgi:ABC-type uncharacterized transport system permease subunit